MAGNERMYDIDEMTQFTTAKAFQAIAETIDNVANDPGMGEAMKNDILESAWESWGVLRATLADLLD